jgi:hypothetical protein
MRRRKTTAWLALLLVLVAAPAFGQGASTTTSLSGVVQDKDGGRIPGATVVIKNKATNETKQTATNTEGSYSFPALDPGTYSVTITLPSFKQAVIDDVRLLAATPRTLPATTLEVGALTETVTVKGGSELVRTETPTVSTTIQSELIRSLPRADRNALNFLVFLPGVATPTSNARGSTISGLPQNTINITLDGVSQSNNLQTGDGFFTLVTPRLDAIEEVTMTTAAAGADSSGQGATQVRFVTRSGTNVFQTSLYEYFRHKSLNSNTFFNRLAGLDRPRVTVNTYGGRVGGPIVLPGLFDGHGKAFFFFNLEESWQPLQTRRTRTILRESARLGDFTYNLTSPNTVNLFQLAGNNGHTSTVDPTIGALLQSIRGSVNSAIQSGIGSITASATDPNRETFDFLSDARVVRHSPTFKIDVNLTNRHRLSGSYYWQGFSDDPDTLNNADPVFPGFPGKGITASQRTNGALSLRSTLSTNMVNSVSGGWQWTPEDFFGNITAADFDTQGSYAIALGFGLNNATQNGVNTPSGRVRINWNVDDNFNWLKGNHSITTGFSFSRFEHHGDNWNNAPNITLGLNTTFDPAAGVGATNMFQNAAGFLPGATTTDLGNARAMYALLTGRVTQIGGTGRINEAGDQYIYNGHLQQRVRMDEYGWYGQDSWRWKPNLTITMGLRYELQMPLVPTNGTFTTSTMTDLCGPSGEGNFRGRQCNLFAPGSLLNPTQVPTYVFYNAGNAGYSVDKNNFAPNVGASWRPNVQNGWLRRMLGDPEQATISGGFSRSFNRERLDTFLNVFSGNPGGTTPATRGTQGGQFTLVDTTAGQTWPLLLRECSPNNGGRCAQPSFQQTPVFPILASFANGNDIRVFDPTLQTPYTDSWQIGLQRAVNRDTVVEMRYIGNVNRKPWGSENWNNENILENGFLDEFKLAQANLRANIAAGRGNTFAYTGFGDTSPLPIFLTHFAGGGIDGRLTANSTNASLYSSTNFTNSTFVNALNIYNADPYGVAASLWTTGTLRTNMNAAGFPSNFWVLNPLVDDATVTRNVPKGSNYHSLQLDVRRRLSHGLQVQGSYTYAIKYNYSIPNADFHEDFMSVRALGDRDPLPHSYKGLWLWELPFGRGKRFGTNVNKWIDTALGGWQFSGTGRVQRPLIRLTNTNLVGMTHEQAQDIFSQLRFSVDPATGSTTVWNMPEDVYTNTRLAYATNATALNGYVPGTEPSGRYFQPADGPFCTLNPGAMALRAGDCTPDLFFNGKWFAEFDFKLAKKFQIGRRATAEFAAEIFNAFRAVNFNQNLNPGTGANTFRITSGGSGARTGQLSWRVSF